MLCFKAKMRGKSHKEARAVKSYLFRVVVEPDEDVWRAYVPELEAKGAATWGHTKEEAFRNIEEVLQMVVEDLLEQGEPLPQSVTVADEPMVAVNV
jgi:predicted RNase H-like HicB family nuclease